MCGTCGCSDGTTAKIVNLETGEESPLVSETRGDHHHDHGHDHHHDHHHNHGHGHGHNHAHDHAHLHAGRHGTTVPIEQAILHKNDELAARNRAWFAGREVLALNLVSSPGAGKTTLLERTIVDLKDSLAISVIEGDQQTVNDAERIRACGVASVQINTGTGCHLEADMVMRGVRELRPAPGSVVMIENVGNLVCPALFDLGESARVAILSVTEGDDKPAKYPHMFQGSDLIVVNKIDLLPYVDFDVERAIEQARALNPEVETIRLSAKTGEGLESWYDWIARQADKARERAFAPGDVAPGDAVSGEAVSGGARRP